MVFVDFIFVFLVEFGGFGVCWCCVVLWGVVFLELVYVFGGCEMVYCYGCVVDCGL